MHMAATSPTRIAPTPVACSDHFELLRRWGELRRLSPGDRDNIGPKLSHDTQESTYLRIVAPVCAVKKLQKCARAAPFQHHDCARSIRLAGQIFAHKTDTHSCYHQCYYYSFAISLDQFCRLEPVAKRSVAI